MIKILGSADGSICLLRFTHWKQLPCHMASHGHRCDAYTHPIKSFPAQTRKMTAIWQILRQPTFFGIHRCLFDDGSNTPTREALASLSLRDGHNAMDFRVGDTIVASAALFSWRHDDRVIIVDIDGTITKAHPCPHCT